MKSIGLSPSVSLDGPAWLHDRTRLRHNGRGSHADVMRGIAALRDGGVSVAINTTLTRDVIAHLDAYFDFVEAQGFTKLIFGRLVDVPADAAVSTGEFYAAIRHIAEIVAARGLEGRVEVGNLEAYRRALAGRADRVCTMFREARAARSSTASSTCSAMCTRAAACSARIAGSSGATTNLSNASPSAWRASWALPVAPMGPPPTTRSPPAPTASSSARVPATTPAPRGAFVRWFGNSTQMASALTRRPETAG